MDAAGTAAIQQGEFRRLQLPGNRCGCGHQRALSASTITSPTKDRSASRGQRRIRERWAEYTSELIDKELEKDPDPVRVWTKAFRGTAFSEAHMCPCTVLGAASQDLPEQVAKEVKGFFKMCQGKLVAEVGSRRAKRPKCCRPSRGLWWLPMPWATLPNMTEPPAICCVRARPLKLSVAARADQERSVLQR